MRINFEGLTPKKLALAVAGAGILAGGFVFASTNEETQKATPVIQELDEKQLQELTAQNKKLQAMLMKQEAELATIQGMLSELQNEPEKPFKVFEGDNTQEDIKPMREAPEPSERYSPKAVYVKTPIQETPKEEKPEKPSKTTKGLSKEENPPKEKKQPEKPSEATKEPSKGENPPEEKEQPEKPSEEPELCRNLECAVSDGNISGEEWETLSEQERFRVLVDYTQLIIGQTFWIQGDVTGAYKTNELKQKYREGNWFELTVNHHGTEVVLFHPTKEVPRGGWTGSAKVIGTLKGKPFLEVIPE